MTTGLLSPCSEPRCPELTRGGPCPAHRRERERRPERVAAKAFYRSPAWRRLRAAHLAANPWCVDCGARGIDVDHVTPISAGGARLDRTNLATRCHACHSRKTLAETKSVGGRRTAQHTDFVVYANRGAR